MVALHAVRELPLNLRLVHLAREECEGGFERRGRQANEMLSVNAFILKTIAT